MALTFFWRCEGTTLDGTHDFTAGDNTATLNGGAEISAAAALIGSNGLNCPTADDYAIFSPASIISVGAGAVAFSFRTSTWNADKWIFFTTGTAPSDFLAIALNGTDEIQARHRVAGGSDVTIVTTAANLVVDTVYRVVCRWDTTADDFRLEVYNSSNVLIEAVESLSTGIDNWADVLTFNVGAANTGAGVHIDNVFIADAYDEALENFLSITSYTQYGSSSAVVVPGQAQRNRRHTGRYM